MRKNLFVMLVMLFGIFLIHCSKQKETGITDINVQEIKEKVEPVELQFTLEKSIPVTEISYPFMFFYTDKIYLSGFGRKNNSGPEMIVVQKFTKNMEFQGKKYFNIGEGPGDLGTGPRFSGSGDFIFVSDNTQRRITVLNKEMEYVKMVRVKWPIFSPIFYNNGTRFICYLMKSISVVQGIQGDCCIVTFPEFSVKSFQSYGPFQPHNPRTGKFMIGKRPGYHFFLKGNSIYYLNMDTYEIGKFDRQGNLQKRIRVMVEKLKVPPSKRLEWLKIQKGGSLQNLHRFELTDTIQPASWMIPLGKGFVVIRRYSYDTDCEGMVEGDYFSYDLELKGKVKVPCFWYIFTLRNNFHAQTFKYEDGYLYIINDSGDDFILEKWQVKE